LTARHSSAPLPCTVAGEYFFSSYFSREQRDLFLPTASAPSHGIACVSAHAVLRDVKLIFYHVRRARGLNRGGKWTPPEDDKISMSRRLINFHHNLSLNSNPELFGTREHGSNWPATGDSDILHYIDGYRLHGAKACAIQVYRRRGVFVTDIFYLSSS
jgi:hypothetical protein